MPEPITLTVVATALLTEGVKFLYSQTGEIIKRWRERKKKIEESSILKDEQRNDEKKEPIDITLPEAFEGKLNSPAVNFAVVNKIEPQMREIRQQLSEYIDGTYNIDNSNAETLSKIDKLRKMLELILGENIKFRGESHPESGTPLVYGKVEVEQLIGSAIGVEAVNINEGEVKGEVNAKVINKDGMAIGVKAGDVGKKRNKD